jgi:hypothetical protein
MDCWRWTPLYSLKAVAHWLRHGHWAVTRTLESWDCVECDR